LVKGVTENKIVHPPGLVWLGLTNPRQGATGRIIFLEIPKSVETDTDFANTRGPWCGFLFGDARSEDFASLLIFSSTQRLAHSST